MSKKKTFWVGVQYQGQCEAFESYLKKTVGKNYSSKGFCLGSCRSDITWEFNSKKTAEAAVKRLNDMQIKDKIQVAIEEVEGA